MKKTEITQVNTEGFEIETCSRCGGSGTYSYCQTYGTTCFKCSGRKVMLTKRGAVAYEYFQDLMSAPFETLKEGDQFFDKSCGWQTLKSAVPLTVDNAESWSTVNGVRVVMEGALQVVSSSKSGTLTSYHKAGVPIRVHHTAEAKSPKLAKAIEYQSTLTANGKVRKHI